MNLKQCFLTKNNCYINARTHTVKGILVHSTGANNPNLRRYVQPNDGLLGDNAAGNHWNQATPDNQSKCVHAFIGKLLSGAVATYQTLPWTCRGWHSGSGSLGSAKNANNNGYIGFEICEDDLDDETYFEAVYQEAVELCAYLCEEYGLDPLTDICCHCEGWDRGIASNHSDVLHWWPKFGKNMDTFRTAVRAAMQPEKIKNEEEEEVARYEKLKDIPNNYGFRDIIEKLMDAKIITGDGSDPAGNNDKIDLSHDQVRSLVFEYRGGAFDRKLKAEGLDPVVDD